jgi:hypothetical protein
LSYEYNNNKLKFEVKLNNPYPEDIITNDSTIQAAFQIRQYFAHDWYVLQDYKLHDFTIKDGKICYPEFELDYELPNKTFLVLTFNSLDPIPTKFRIDSEHSE